MLTWKDVVDDPVLADLPYKIELAGSGRIVMCLTQSRHSISRGQISAVLTRLMRRGSAFPGCPVDTDDNTKVIDVVWASRDMIKRYADELSWPVAPPICLEVVSPSNTRKELREKIRLYFPRGAQECWICDQNGAMSFFTAAGQQPASALCPKFPVRMKI